MLRGSSLMLPDVSTASAQRRNSACRPPSEASRRRETSSRDSTSMPATGEMRALTVDFAIFEDAPCITCNRCKSIWDLEVSGGEALARKRNNAESIRVDRSSHEDEDGGTLRLRPCGPTLRACPGESRGRTDY